MSRYFEKGREPVSSYTHFWGALASALGTLALVARCRATGAGGLVLAGVVLFGLSLVALYSASSIYHYALGAAVKLRRLRKLDHAMIYVLIAGSDSGQNDRREEKAARSAAAAEAAGIRRRAG